jgi:hypothetical protein
MPYGKGTSSKKAARKTTKKIKQLKKNKNRIKNNSKK